MAPLWMKNTNAVRTEIHYAQVGEYQLPLLILSQTDDTKPLGKYSRMRLAYLKNQRPVLPNQKNGIYGHGRERYDNIEAVLNGTDTYTVDTAWDALKASA